MIHPRIVVQAALTHKSVALIKGDCAFVVLENLEPQAVELELVKSDKFEQLQDFRAAACAKAIGVDVDAQKRERMHEVDAHKRHRANAAPIVKNRPIASRRAVLQSLNKASVRLCRDGFLVVHLFLDFGVVAPEPHALALFGRERAEMHGFASPKREV